MWGGILWDDARAHTNTRCLWMGFNRVWLTLRIQLWMLHLLDVNHRTPTVQFVRWNGLLFTALFFHWRVLLLVESQYEAWSASLLGGWNIAAGLRAYCTERCKMIEAQTSDVVIRRSKGGQGLTNHHDQSLSLNHQFCLYFNSTIK